MSLSQAEKQELLAQLEEGNSRKKVMRAQRIIPDDYKAYAAKVDREEITLTVPECDVPVRVVITRAKDRIEKCPVHVNYHGGGFVFPQDGDDDMYCAHLATEIHGITVDVDYAILPDHPFPTAFNQSYGVAKWVFENAEAWGADAGRISIGGSSAGGCLATAIALKCTKTHDFTPCLLVMEYAANDNYMAVLPEGNPRSRVFSLLYADGDTEGLKNPYVSPVFATEEELVGMPRTLIVNAQDCPFRDPNENLGMRMIAAGVEVTMRRYVNSHHGFLVRINGEWAEAQQLIIDTINNI